MHIVRDDYCRFISGCGNFERGGKVRRAATETTRLKPLRCVCGTIIDESGEVVLRADVVILKDGTEIATVETGKNGKFSFQAIKPGSYDLQARAFGFRVFSAPIVVANPAKKCRQRLEIVMVGGLETCLEVRVVNRPVR
jgi:hypothetical protein